MNWLKEKWAALRAWWRDKAVHSVIVARATVLLGIVIGVVSNTDLTALADGKFEWKQAASLIAIGVLQEYARRYNAKDI